MMFSWNVIIPKLQEQYNKFRKHVHYSIGIANLIVMQDLHRTFSSYGGEEFRTKLKRVLQCYAAYNPEVGYCQVISCLYMCSSQLS